MMLMYHLATIEASTVGSNDEIILNEFVFGHIYNYVYKSSEMLFFKYIILHWLLLGFYLMTSQLTLSTVTNLPKHKARSRAQNLSYRHT